MIGKRSLQVKMVKDSALETITVPNMLDSLDFKAIDKIVREYAMKAAIGAVLIYAAVKTIDTASEVTVNLTTPRR